jgi:hypothetical protein
MEEGRGRWRTGACKDSFAPFEMAGDGICVEVYVLWT